MRSARTCMADIRALAGKLGWDPDQSLEGEI
jgi:hypothetical protein